jgi:glycosyltransferase involved in cell wall biosynthesis
MGDKVSILIPVYNREQYIKDTVTSAVRQTYQDIEIVIVDNHSTDRTWEILKNLANQDPRIKLFQNITNVGPVKNWSRCVEEATGKYGKILWSDDLISSDFLEKTINFLNDEDVGFVFTGTEVFFDENAKKINTYFIGETGVYESDRFIKGVFRDEEYPASPGCALFRLDDLKRNLMVDIPNRIGSDFSMHGIGSDLLIFLLTAQHYRKFAFVNEKLSFFRAHKDSISLSSSKGVLILHYDLVKSFFAENFRPDLIPQLNAIIWLHLKLYSCPKKYTMNSLRDFYVRNDNFNFSWTCLILHMFQKKLKIFLLKIYEIRTFFK